MEEAIRNSIYADRENHICVSRKPEETCSEWNIQKETNCPFNDIDPYPLSTPGGLTQCQDLCLQRQPECKHVAYNEAGFKQFSIAFPYNIGSILYRPYKGPYGLYWDVELDFDLKPIKLPRDWSSGQECWLKTELINCFFEEGVTIGSLMHYDCKDNHNCGGSFVKFQVCLKIS